MEIKLSPGSVFKPAEGITWRDIKGEEQTYRYVNRLDKAWSRRVV